MPLDWCGDCPACRAGHSHVCHNLNFIGIDSPGSMQRHWTVPARVLVALPDDVSLLTAALAEPTAVAVHDVRRAGLAPGEQALVVGGGPIGLLIALVARAKGAEVLVLELSEERRVLARSLGLECLDPARGRRLRADPRLDLERRRSGCVRGVRRGGGYGDGDPVSRGARPARRRGDPRDSPARESLSRVLARADARRRPGL